MRLLAAKTIAKWSWGIKSPLRSLDYDQGTMQLRGGPVNRFIVILWPKTLEKSQIADLESAIGARCHNEGYGNHIRFDYR